MVNPIAWLLSKLSPVPVFDYQRIKHSVPNDESKRVQRFTGDPRRHRLTRPELVQRRRGIA